MEGNEVLKYVSPEYQAQLDRLAELLCNPNRFGAVAVKQEVEIPPNVLVGEE